MKKILYLFLALTFGIVMTSSSPSLDGRAVVAKKGDFPPGLFAKTVGYLPGDSISVTNPANNQNVEILVIGSLDPSEGVAVLLSPEAADVLQIKRNSNMLVKLTKRSGELDENASGTCVLTQSGSSAYIPAEYEEEEDAPVIEEPQEVAEEIEDEELEDEIEEADVVAVEDEDFEDDTEAEDEAIDEELDEEEVAEEETEQEETIEVAEEDLYVEDEIPEEFASPCNERSQYTDTQVDDNLAIFAA